MNVKLDHKRTGKLIRLYRKQRGWTKNELVERAAITRELFDYYEKGVHVHVVNLNTIIRIANALNVRPERLLAWKQEDEDEQ